MSVDAIREAITHMYVYNGIAAEWIYVIAETPHPIHGCENQFPRLLQCFFQNKGVFNFMMIT